MNFRNLTIRARLTAAFGCLAVIVLLVSALSIRALGQAHEEYAGYVNDAGLRLTLANDVLDAANARAVGARNLVLVSSPAEREAERAAVAQAHQKVTTSLGKLEQALSTTTDATEQERKRFVQMRDVESRYGPVASDIVALASSGKHEEAIRKMNVECRPLLAGLLKAANEYIVQVQSTAALEVKTAESHYQLNRNLMVAGCLGAFALTMALSMLITRGLTRALGAEPAQLSEAAQRVASGDLCEVPGGGSAPAGSVLASLCAMQAGLARVVSQVRHASDSIATGSAQIATGNADLSQRTEEQASNLQQTAASMEQMNATVQNTSATAHQATQLAQAASAAAEKGGSVVAQVVTTMGDISTSSSRIADIIGVIDGIAFQTNILALNAAVEAARAGEQGRGFAVVASEVRSLAQRSAEAAKEIKHLIAASVEKVEAGSRQVGDAGASMNDIVAQVRRVASLIADMNAATTEQTTGIGQVSDAVTQLDQVTQQNAALVEQSAAAADSLRQQAARLAEVVSTFKLQGAAAPTVAA